MKEFAATVLGSTLALASTSAVMAQSNYLAPPINNWSYVGHSSTFEEGYLRGSAAVVQSVGQANYMNSLAAVNFQEAARQGIENRNLYVRKVIENQELTRQYRQRYTAVAPTKEEWQRVSDAIQPDRLTPEQYDAATGRLIWPHILRTDEYQVYRDRIDKLFSMRTPDNSGDGSPPQRELAQLIDGMKRLLRTNMDSVSFSQYTSAKWFLMSLDYEAQLPLKKDAVAIDNSVAADVDAAAFQ